MVSWATVFVSGGEKDDGPGEVGHEGAGEGDRSRGLRSLVGLAEATPPVHASADSPLASPAAIIAARRIVRIVLLRYVIGTSRNRRRSPGVQWPLHVSCNHRRATGIQFVEDRRLTPSDKNPYRRPFLFPAVRQPVNALPPCRP